MPRDGTGKFTRDNSVFTGPTTWQQQANSPDDTIRSDRHDSHDEDMATALTDSLDRTGKGSMQANLNLGNFGLTGGSDTAGNELKITPSTRTVARSLAVQALLAQGQVYDVTDPEYGAVAEGADGTVVDSNIQAAMDAAAAAGGGIVWVPAAPSGKYYRTNNPLLARDGVILMGEGRQSLIYNDRATETEFSDQACWLWGNQTFTFDEDNLTQYTIQDVTAPTFKITTATAADAGNFSAGQVIVVLSGAHYDAPPSSKDVHHYYLMTRVVSANAGSGEIVLEQSIDRDLATTGGRAPSILDPNQSGVTGWRNVPIFTSYRAGLWNVAFQSNNQFTVGGGGLECFMDRVWIDAEGGNSMIGGNRMSSCTFENLFTRGGRRFTENKLGSHDNIFRNIYFTLRDSSVTTPAMAIDFGEGARDIIYDGFFFDLGDKALENYPIGFQDANGNLVTNGIVLCGGVTNRVLNFSRSLTSTPDEPECRDNTVETVRFVADNPSQFFVFDTVSGLEDKLVGNRIIDCRFSGRSTVGRTGTLNGTGNQVHESKFTDTAAGMLWASTATRLVVSNNENIGRWTPSSRGLMADMTLNVVYGNSSGQSDDARANQLIDNAGDENITSTTPGNIVGTANFPAGALALGDYLEFEVLGTVSANTSADKQIRIADNDGDIASLTIPAAVTGNWSIRGTITIKNNSTYSGHFPINWGAGSNQEEDNTLRQALDLDANGRKFDVQAWVDGAGPIIRLRSARIEIRKAGYATKLTG